MNDDNDRINHGLPDGAPEGLTEQPGDAELDALLLRFGGEYNRPSDFVPREEMWHEIQRYGTQKPVERRRSVISLLAAAVVLLAAGIGIGVEANSRITARADITHSVAQAGSATTPSVTTPSVTTPDVPTATATTDNGSNLSTPQLAAVAPRDVRSVQPNIPGGGYASTDRQSESNAASRSTAYSLATVRHFTAVEALLTSYQTSTHDARGDAQMAAWARSLLSQTRLLLDSPAAKDPARNQLLQDLELILVQMTQLSPADTPIDRQIMDGSVNHSDVITRLRTAVPAGASTTL